MTTPTAKELFLAVWQAQVSPTLIVKYEPHKHRGFWESVWVGCELLAEDLDVAHQEFMGEVVDK